MGNLTFADEILTIILCPLWGVLSDKIGTRPVAVTGIFLIGVNFFVYTTAKSVYPGLLFLRLFFAVGASAAASMITAILSEISTFRVQPAKLVRNVVEQIKAKIRGRDSYSSLPNDIEPGSSVDAYAERSGRFHDDEASGEEGEEISPAASYRDGRDFEDEDDSEFLELVEPGRRNGMSAALVGLSSGLGACFAVFVLLTLPMNLEKYYSAKKAIKVAYYIVASIAIVVSAALFFGLHRDRTKSVKYWLTGYVSEFDKAANNVSDEEPPSYLALLKEGFSIALTEKQIALAYMGGFVARSTTVATVMFIPLVINVYFHNQGSCSGNIHDPDSELKSSCPKAYLISAIVTGISQTAALFLAPVWGYTTDKFGRKATLLVSSVIGFVGFLGFACLSNPTSSPFVYIFGTFMGIAQIGTIIASMSLCTDTKRNSSGAIAGVYSFCGGIGILILSKLGGWLSDIWAGSPFIILAVFYVALIVMTLSQMPESTDKFLRVLRIRSNSGIRLDDTE